MTEDESTDQTPRDGDKTDVEARVRPQRQHLVSELLEIIREREELADEMQDYPLEVDGLLRDALREGATDIHLDPRRQGLLVRMRIDGIVLDATLLNHDQATRLINQFKSMVQLSPVTHFLPEEGRAGYDLDGESLSLRLTEIPCLNGNKINVRLFRHQSAPHQLDQLGLHEKALEDLQEWIGNISGMLLVCGPAGSGKTTTLYALLHQLRLHEINVVTIEDPVEYEIDGINHMQVDQQHGLDFASGLQAILRLDPDYLMLGEIRDAASAHAALAAAASGHPLMSTLHSRDAVGVVDALRNMGLNGHDISANLMLVLAQRLVRMLCPHCKSEEPPTEEERQWLQLLGREVPERVSRANGCGSCKGLGYLGRTGVFEVWRSDPDEYEMILEGADRRTLYRHLAQRNHRFLLDDGLTKVAQGITTLSELRGMGGFSALPAVDRD
ncbi:MAG: GspE/PulE family protein [Candidatus Sedimenticola sp. (ex Thyasira tokunagai)]